MNKAVQTEKPASMMAVFESARHKFTTIDMANGRLLDFEAQCLFAKQQIMRNDKAIAAASSNPGALKSAILNVAAIGLSLNPANKHAYLLPRAGVICLGISYRGLVKLATDTGSIKWARADIVYEADSFVYNGPDQRPTHTVDNAFGDRGKFVGAYCIAKTVDGDILTEIINAKEMDAIEAKSMAKFGPWKDFKNEMRKKSVIKRASKTWPESDRRQRFNTAVEVVNQHEGLEPHQSFFSEDQYTEFHDLIKSENAAGFYGLRRAVDVETWVALTGAYKNTAPRGQKQAFSAIVDDMLKQGEKEIKAIAETIEGYIQANQIDAAVEAWSELSSNEQRAVLEQIDSYDVLTVNEDSK